MENEITCKYCGSGGVLKYGTYKGVPRYWCKVCQRKFKADDTTFHMKKDTNLVSSSLYVVSENGTIRPSKIADALKAMPLLPSGSIIIPPDF